MGPFFIMVNKKYIFVFIFSLCLLLLALFSQIQSKKSVSIAFNIQVGDRLPDVFLEEIRSKNNEFRFNENKIIILNFWASWCSPCVEEFPSLINLSKLLSEKLTVFAVTQDSDASELNAFLKIYQVKSLSNFYVVDDGDHTLSGKLGIERLPETWIVSADHILLKKIVGAIDWSSSDVVSFLKEIK